MQLLQTQPIKTVQLHLILLNTISENSLMCFFCGAYRKYPSIHSDEERDQYRAVFNDQYAEYKELHAEVQAMAKRFDEMDEIMRNLPPRPSSEMVTPFYMRLWLGHLK